MNEKAELSDLASALLRGLQGPPKKNKDYARIAEYAATIFGLSVQSTSEECFHENANNAMIFFKGFVSFCGLAVGLSEDECVGAFEAFFVEITGLPHQEGAMTFSALDRMAKTPQGIALINAGRLAAYDCQEGNMTRAVAALRIALEGKYISCCPVRMKKRGAGISCPQFEGVIADACRIRLKEVRQKKDGEDIQSFIIN